MFICKYFIFFFVIKLNIFFVVFVLNYYIFFCLWNSLWLVCFMVKVIMKMLIEGEGNGRIIGLYLLFVNSVYLDGNFMLLFFLVFELERNIGVKRLKMVRL